MKPFLSWSKDISRETAKCFAAWLPTVIQECHEVFLSHEISKGEPWFERITTNLTTCELGIVFITAENQHEPWLNFEAGALLNKFGKSGVCPVLVKLKKADYVGPLSNLQLTEFESEADMRGLLSTINDRCNSPLKADVLRKMFDTFWSSLVESVEEAVSNVSQTQHPNSAIRPVEQKIDEILNLVRALSSEFDHPSLSDGRLKERLDYFTKKYGSLNMYRKSDSEVGQVIDFGERDGNLQYVVAHFNGESGGRVYLKDEIEVIPF